VGERLTRAMRDQLASLADTTVYDVSDESVVRALARRGFAERFVERAGFLANRHQWRITDAGRSALAKAQEKSR
jgi:hypothetical protein